MKIFLDTNILLNDFFHRHPDYGFQRISSPEQAGQVEQYRSMVHETLLWLSLKPSVTVCTSTFIVSRLASLFGDLLVPKALVAEEMQYLLSGFLLSEPGISHLETALTGMQGADQTADFDDYLLRQLAKESACDILLTSLSRSRTFFWPVLVFRPEELRGLNWEELENAPDTRPATGDQG